MEQEIDDSEVIETPETEAPEVSETTEEEIVEAPEGETAEEKAERLEEVNGKLFARAKKAEGFELIEGKWVKKPKTTVAPKPAPKKEKEADLSTTDLYALMNAKVPQEDVEEVRRAAKALGVTVAEALKDPITTGILERRQTLRKTADATNTGIARPGSKKVTDEQLLSDASKGILPEKGSKEAEQLFWAKRGGKK